MTEGVGGGGSSMENEQYLEFASLLGEGTYAHAAPHSLVQGGASTGGPASQVRGTPVKRVSPPSELKRAYHVLAARNLEREREHPRREASKYSGYEAQSGLKILRSMEPI